MKTWLVTILGLILFIILGLLNQMMLIKNTNRLAVDLKKVEQAIRVQQWNEADTQLTVVQKKWNQVKPIWTMLLHHREIDNIDQSLVKTRRAIRAANLPAAEVEQGSLAEYIEHIPKREECSLVNIF